MATTQPLSRTLVSDAYCTHCGQDCRTTPADTDGAVFCCDGCRQVYHLIRQHDLGEYYRLKGGASQQGKGDSGSDYAYLNDPEIRQRFIDFEDNRHYRVSLHVPDIHCTACVYLLERLHRFIPGISESRVDYLRKELQLKVAKPGPDLPEIARLLHRLGYPPEWQSTTSDSRHNRKQRNQLIRKMAVAGFAFGNIMLLSLSDYLSTHGIEEPLVKSATRMLSLLLSLPVVAYSASDYFTTAWEALKKKIIKLDIPIAIGVAVLFLRSTYEIASGAGTGYLDSLSALVFFLLLGRLFQEKTFHHIQFDRGHASFFPLAVLRRQPPAWGQELGVVNPNRSDSALNPRPAESPAGPAAPGDADEQEVGIHHLVAGDRIRVRHQEVVPADSLLVDSSGLIDYSFVTGESEPVACYKGDVIYAGGRVAGTSLVLEVMKPAAEAYLMRLWNQNSTDPSPRQSAAYQGTADRIARFFTPAVILIALAGFGAWWPYSPSTAFQVLSAVLIIACPCALALSAPLSLGNGLRLLSRAEFFARNTSTLDRLARIRCLVFDKTGTLSHQELGPMNEDRVEWDQQQRSLVQAVCRNSTHPLSKMIARSLPYNPKHNVQLYDELEGKGINALVDGHNVQIGQPFGEAHNNSVDSRPHAITGQAGTGNQVHIRIDGRYLGYVHFAPIWRQGIGNTLHELGRDYEMHLLSGDGPRDGQQIARWFPPGSTVRFRQSPHDKKQYVEEMSGHRSGGVAMFGDGLNDAGALQSADIGIAVSENSGQFTPACDAILAGQSLHKLPQILKFVRSLPRVLYINLLFSVAYNLVGLSFALSGTLTPLLSAIFMPISSLTVLMSSVLLTRYLAYKHKLL